MSYLNELEAHLHALPRDERDETMAYYDEYFTDADLSNSAARKQFGTPKQFARRLVADFYMDADDASEIKPKQQLRMIWVVILGLLASPVILPVAILMVVLLISALAIVFSMAVTIASMIMAIVITALVSIVAGIAIVFSSLSGGIFFIGVGLAAIGVLVLIGPLMFSLMRMCFNGLVNLIKAIGRRFIKKGASYEA
ncbi:DUF1700 domain-containing protein [Leuconostoc sp. MS02]|uniref:DUF1700 domain-containing protein n=1 Tax=Leuconostoc aquikimchii TaxID=3236804 RepID=A0ABV3S273_9LACO